MAFNAREIDAPPAHVFAVIADPRTYPDWLVGAAKIRSVDHHWPSPGAKFHHVVGVRPFALADSTEVVDVEPDRRLQLRVRSRPALVADVTFEITGDDERSTITMREEPAGRPFSNLARPVFDPMIHLRNQRSLARLERVVTESAGAGGG